MTYQIANIYGLEAQSGTYYLETGSTHYKWQVDMLGAAPSVAT